MAEKVSFSEQLSDILVRMNVFTEKEAQSLQKNFKDSEKTEFDTFLLEEGLLEKEDLLKALSQYYKMPSFDVEGFLFDHDLVVKFPKGFLLRNGVIPYLVEGFTLMVIAGNPEDTGLESALRGYVSYDIEFMVGIRRDICDAVKEFYDMPLTMEIPQDLDLRQERLQEQVEEEALDEDIDEVVE